MPSDPRPGADEAIDDDLVGLLNGCLAPEPLDDATAGRVRHRLLQRIADAETERHVTVHASEGRWQPVGPGLQLKVLHREPGGPMSYLVRMAPGSQLPPHRHPVDEECVVLEGELQIGALRVCAGDFHLGRKDLPHTAVLSAEGALIFLRGATPELTLLI